MSALYGYIRWGGRPVAPESFSRMKETMTNYPHNGSFEWKSEECMLGHILQWDTPESLHEQFPLLDSSGNTVFMAAGRIDNREDLFRLLAVPHPEREGMTDGQLMFRAYLAWGKEACGKMYGDWSFCAWHRKERKLFLARDHGGIMALYYYAGKDFLAFASTLKGLLCLPEVPRDINELRAAQILTAWPGDGEATYYRHILNLKPGHFLEVQNGNVQKAMFWELTEQPELILPKEEDYYERFRELFAEAVRARLRSYRNVGIQLSGGYDSTSVAAMAAMELAKQNKELYAFTSVPYYKDCPVPKGRIADEGPLAASLAKKYPNIRHFLVDAAGYNVLEAIDRAVDMFCEPMHAAGNQYWIQAIYDKARENDVSVLLNAQGGNGVISWPTGKPRLYAMGGLPWLKFRVKSVLKDVRTLTTRPLHYWYPFLDYSYISIPFARRNGLLEKMKAAGHDPRFRSQRPFKQAQRHLMDICLLNAYSLHYRMSVDYAIVSPDPSGHIPLMQFMLSVPEPIYRANAYRRIFIGKAMDGFLPSEILSSKGKGLQAADLMERFKNVTSFDTFDFLNLNGNAVFLDRKKIAGSAYKFQINELNGRMNEINHFLRVYGFAKMN
ncbi:MAG: asparagine synthetase B [Bacteroidales bacterium]|nr:asparagine synthetase B [Bacteroidales bacterium]